MLFKSPYLEEKLKTQLEPTTSQERLNSIIIINLEPEFSYKIFDTDIVKITDIFAKRKNRNKNLSNKCADVLCIVRRGYLFSLFKQFHLL